MATSISTFTLPSSDAFKLVTDGPEVLQAAYKQVPGNGLTRATFVVAPAKTPTVDGVSPIDWFPATQGGVAFIPSAGEWWVRANNFPFVTPLGNYPILRIPVPNTDAFDAWQDRLIPNRVTSENDVAAAGVEFTPVVPPGFDFLFAANFYRRRVVIQNNGPAASSVRVTFGFENPTATKGYRIIGGNSLDITDGAWQGINICTDTGAPLVSTLAFMLD